MHFSFSSKTSNSLRHQTLKFILFHLSTVEVILLLFLSTCRNDLRAKPVSEPGNIWAGFEEPEWEKLGNSLPQGAETFLCALLVSTVCLMDFQNVCCLFTCILASLLYSLFALVTSFVCLTAIHVCFVLAQTQWLGLAFWGLVNAGVIKVMGCSECLLLWHPVKLGLEALLCFPFFNVVFLQIYNNCCKGDFHNQAYLIWYIMIYVRFG